MLSINSIKKGIVLDHIKPGHGYEIFKVLGLHEADYRVALIMNAESKKQGRKDMIKIEDEIDLDLTAIGIIDSNVTVNVIEDEKIVNKIHITLPEYVEGKLQCTNPKCISVVERDVKSKFSLVDSSTKTYKCDYCDHFYGVEE